MGLFYDKISSMYWPNIKNLRGYIFVRNNHKICTSFQFRATHASDCQEWVEVLEHASRGLGLDNDNVANPYADLEEEVDPEMIEEENNENPVQDVPVENPTHTISSSSSNSSLSSNDSSTSTSSSSSSTASLHRGKHESHYDVPKGIPTKSIADLGMWQM